MTVLVTSLLSDALGALRSYDRPTARRNGAGVVLMKALPWQKKKLVNIRKYPVLVASEAQEAIRLMFAGIAHASIGNSGIYNGLPVVAAIIHEKLPEAYKAVANRIANIRPLVPRSLEERSPRRISYYIEKMKLNKTLEQIVTDGLKALGLTDDQINTIFNELRQGLAAYAASSRAVQRVWARYAMRTGKTVEEVLRERNARTSKVEKALTLGQAAAGAGAGGVAAGA